jgi:hypothetical protein
MSKLLHKCMTKATVTCCGNGSPTADGDSVTANDYEVPGLTSDGRHFFWILGLDHVMT